jgi:ribosomal protein L3 glutamine methyltransferase
MSYYNEEKQMLNNNYHDIIVSFETIRDVFRFFQTCMNQSSLCYGHGTDNAWDEALLLIFDTLKLPHHAHQTFLDAKLTQDEKLRLADHLHERIIHKKPIPYLTHIAWFAEIPFYVDERVIVPRSPIAELIMHAFSPWIASENIHQVLDLCTGSGCIAIATALGLEHVRVDAVDISQEALTVAKINIEKFHVADRVHLIESDLFTQVPKKQYDLIISNPPYVDALDMSTLPEEFTHEPVLALASGVDGLEATLRILKDAGDYLTESGILIVEVGNSQEALIERFPAAPFTWLEFEHGGAGVFLLTAAQLRAMNH